MEILTYDEIAEVLWGNCQTSAPIWCAGRNAWCAINVFDIESPSFHEKKKNVKSMHHGVLVMDGCHCLNEHFESQMYVQVAIFFHL